MPQYICAVSSYYYDQEDQPYDCLSLCCRCWYAVKSAIWRFGPSTSISVLGALSAIGSTTAESSGWTKKAILCLPLVRVFEFSGITTRCFYKIKLQSINVHYNQFLCTHYFFIYSRLPVLRIFLKSMFPTSHQCSLKLHLANVLPCTTFLRLVPLIRLSNASTILTHTYYS